MPQLLGCVCPDHLSPSRSSHKSHQGAIGKRPHLQGKYSTLCGGHHSPIRVLSQKHVLFIPRPVLWTGQGCFKRQQNAKPTSNKKLRILAASLALQQVKEVGAVTTQEEVTTECNIQIYIILALTVTIFWYSDDISSTLQKIKAVQGTHVL